MKSTCWNTRATDPIIKSGQKNTEGSITLYNVCLVPWGDIMWVISRVSWVIFSTVVDIMINVGGYLEYREVCSVTWGDIISTGERSKFCGEWQGRRTSHLPLSLDFQGKN